MKIDVTDDGRGNTLITTAEPVGYTVAGRLVVIAPGFVSDGMSCPKWTQWLLSPQVDARTLHAGLCHDHIYQYHLFTRWEADAFFYHDLVRHGYPMPLAALCWLGVRCAGWIYWNIPGPETVTGK